MILINFQNFTIPQGKKECSSPINATAKDANKMAPTFGLPNMEHLNSSIERLIKEQQESWSLLTTNNVNSAMPGANWYMMEGSTNILQSIALKN